MRRAVACFFLGLLLGSTAISALHSTRLDRLHWEKEKLKVELFETTERLQIIEKQWAGHAEGEIREVVFIIKNKENKLNSFEELSLRQQLADITAGLIGKQIDTLHPELLRLLLDERRLTVENKSYRLAVNSLIIAREITYYLTVSPAD